MGSMNEQTFVVKGIPKAQGRPRFARMGKFVRAYDPKDSRAYKDNFAAQIAAQKPRFIEQGKPVALDLAFYLPRPKVHYRADGAVKERYASTEPTGRPDTENMVKACMDAMTGVVWYDDSQVVSLHARKYYDTVPRTVVWVVSV